MDLKISIEALAEKEMEERKTMLDKTAQSISDFEASEEFRLLCSDLMQERLLHLCREQMAAAAALNHPTRTYPFHSAKNSPLSF